MGNIASVQPYSVTDLGVSGRNLPVANIALENFRLEESTSAGLRAENDAGAANGIVTALWHHPL